MHYFLTTFGSAGDVFPVLGLAAELVDRGHRVTVATSKHFESKIPRSEIEFIALGTEEDYRRVASNPDLWHPTKGFPYIYENLKPWIPLQYEMLVEAAKSGPITCIANVFGFGALAAQEKYDIPVYTLHLQPAVLWSDIAPPVLPKVVGPRWLKSALFRLGERLVIDRVVCPHLNSWRASIGLPPVKNTIRSWNSPRGILCLFPDWYAQAQRDWPQPCIQTNFPLWNFGSEQSLEPEIQRFFDAGSAPIAFTPGSANVHGAEFFQAAVDACVNLGERGVLLTEFQEQIPVNLPDTVRWIKYAPLEQLLSQSKAFVHHGGIGSSSQALMAGIPQIVMPLAHDQFDNIARLKKLGVGESLHPKQFNAPNLTRSLRGILSNKNYSEAAKRIAQRLKPHQGVKEMAQIIENLGK